MDGIMQCDISFLIKKHHFFSGLAHLENSEEVKNRIGQQAEP